jgi:orotidine-5'-phosphate decarboxylase
MNCDLILALDVPTREEMRHVLQRIGPALRRVKIGLQLFTRYGPDVVREAADLGFKVFLDLKLHDIPNTVAKSVESIAALPVEMLTLHASGGAEMVRWADQARREQRPDLLLLGVTVLTSMNEAGLRETGVAATPEEHVLRLAKLAAGAGLDGFVCSPLEVAQLRSALGSQVQLVTPGIRPAGAPADEQKRTMTPAEAAAAGANFLVVGRPVLRAADPAAAAREIFASMGVPAHG